MTEQQDITCRLYIISPPEIQDLDTFASDLDAALAAGDVACFQLRLKGVDEDVIVRAAETLMPICHEHEVAFLLNDDAALAKQIDADGVHLGQDDGSAKEARELLGEDASIGVTCHDSLHLAFSAGEAGADYVAFGAFFDTVTKDAKTKASLEVLKTWDEVTELSSVAIGGVTPENCRSLADAGAHFVAASNAIWAHPDGPAAAVKAFNEALK